MKINFVDEKYEPLEIQFNGKTYTCRELTGELFEELKEYAPQALAGDLSALARQLSIITGIPHEKLNKLNQLKLIELNEMITAESMKLKKKSKTQSCVPQKS